MDTRKLHSYDSDSTKAPILSLDPLTPATHTKKPSDVDDRVRRLQWFKDYGWPTTPSDFFALNVSVWVVTLTSLRLCGYLEMFDTLHLLLEATLVCILGMFFVWKNFGFYQSTSIWRNSLKQSQQSGAYDSIPTAAELVLTALTFCPVVIEPLRLLPAGVPLVLGDAMISGFLAWMVDRSTTCPICAGSAEVNEDTASSSSPKGVQWEETRARRISAVPSSSAGSTEAGKLTSPRLAADTSQTSAATAIRSGIPNAARRDLVETMVDEAISVLLSRPQAQSILIMILDPRRSEPLGFDDEITPILRDFGRNLAAEREKKALTGAATILPRRQGLVAIAAEMLKGVRHLRSEASGGYLFSSWEDDLSGRKMSTGAQIELSHRAAVSQSSVKSYAQFTFELDLLLCAHRFYGDRLYSIMAGAKLVGHTGTDLSPSNYVSVVQELSWVPSHLVSIVKKTSFSRNDVIKSFVESQMGETWNWWPLAPASCRLRPGYHRLLWESPLGAARYVDVPDSISAALQAAIRTAPDDSLDIGFALKTKASPPSGDTTTASSNGSGKSSLTPSLPNASSLTPSAQPSPTQQSNTPPPLASQNTPMTVQGAATSISLSRYLSLCVTTSSHQFISIRCDILRTDLGFYTRMKHEYNKARGRLRLYFSMWQYDHCEFVRFKKYGYHRGARLKVAFPEQDDLDYDFAPRVPSPAPPDGPVSSDEFRDHYYLPDCPSFYSWRRYQLRLRGHFSRIARETLEAVPKRHTEVNMDDGLNELFYGLYAKERRSFARVASYACLCNLPGVVFFFLWLFRWGHGADLQNASVPLTLSLSLTLGFAAVVFGTRDGG